MGAEYAVAAHASATSDNTAQSRDGIVVYLDVDRE
jgi:hypothetical protein